jgi:DNA polymerase-1
MSLASQFPAGVYLIDFEFHPTHGHEGNPPAPVCLVVRNAVVGEVARYWQDELCQMSQAPFPCGADALCVAYFSSAEWDCFLALGWALPVRVLDLYIEFRVRTNGTSLPHGAGLIGALLYFGHPDAGLEHKEDMRELVLRGGPWNAQEIAAILNYCQADVEALQRLLQSMEPGIDWPRALLRGRYMKAVSRMQATGTPIDQATLAQITIHWNGIQDALIAQLDQNYGVFDGRTFKVDRWAAFLERHQIPWPRLTSGTLDLKDGTFRQMARAYPVVAPMRELRSALAEMRLSDLTVGQDGRNRCLLSPFKSKTGRNQPSNARFIFGPSVWLRGLIKPADGWALAYIDYCQQEFGIAAALSGDPAMMAAYSSGDPYLAFAKQAGAVPGYATKESHKAQREQFKQCVLAVQYGMGAESLASQIGQPTIVARRLLALHRQTYRTFWAWSDNALAEANLNGRLWTVFGWEIQASSELSTRSLRNFPMQANGAEMLRLACTYLTEAGIRVCAPVHDALLIESRAEHLAATVTQAQALMAQASRDVLGGFALCTDVNRIQAPDRYCDPRGAVMWQTVKGLLPPLPQAASPTYPRQAAHPVQSL